MQLLALTCLHLAAKVEEDCPPAPELLLPLTGGAYTKADLARLEREAISALKWGLRRTTAVVFLHYYTEILGRGGRAVLRCARAILDLCLHQVSGAPRHVPRTSCSCWSCRRTFAKFHSARRRREGSFETSGRFVDSPVRALTPRVLQTWYGTVQPGHLATTALLAASYLEGGGWSEEMVRMTGQVRTGEDSQQFSITFRAADDPSVSQSRKRPLLGT